MYIISVIYFLSLLDFGIIDNGVLTYFSCAGIFHHSRRINVKIDEDSVNVNGAHSQEIKLFSADSPNS